jgi:hypothetical protein
MQMSGDNFDYNNDIRYHTTCSTQSINFNNLNMLSITSCFTSNINHKSSSRSSIHGKHRLAMLLTTISHIQSQQSAYDLLTYQLSHSTLNPFNNQVLEHIGILGNHYPKQSHVHTHTATQSCNHIKFILIRSFRSHISWRLSIIRGITHA